mmetsp:Transcript_36909/g.68107  ORF Transcript_36909/g.68107 Transcript_36909/m.68107 type:complete len:466 (+) Transcript_36909:60-1457(+)
MDILSCPVCLDTFSDPHILPSCGHTFCKECIDRLNVSYGCARCPTCRQQFRPAEVRPNFALRTMLTEHVAQGPQANLPSYSDRSLVRTTPGKAHQLLQKNLECAGLPPRLADCMAREDERIGLRIFLLDNSGSTSHYDGKYFVVDHEREVMQSRMCSRWDEIKGMARSQAEWNLPLGVPCEFMLLNCGPPPLREGIDFVRIDPAKRQGSVASLMQMLDATGPHGTTPLADRIADISRRVQSEHAGLVQAGQHIMLTIATDGLPTAKHHTQTTSHDRTQFVQQLKRLMLEFPVHVVIRLCTDDNDVVEYYNQVEEDVELPMDVLDDWVSEAKEIYWKGNGWFTYTQEMHRIREGGSFLKLLDILDERRLTPTEAALLAQLLLHRQSDGPLPRDKEEFCEAMEDLAERAEPVYAWNGYITDAVDVSRLRYAIFGWNPIREAANALHSLFMGCAGHGAPTIQDELDIM